MRRDSEAEILVRQFSPLGRVGVGQTDQFPDARSFPRTLGDPNPLKTRYRLNGTRRSTGRFSYFEQ
jgi:hypothetical protein